MKRNQMNWTAEVKEMREINDAMQARRTAMQAPSKAMDYLNACNLNAGKPEISALGVDYVYTLIKALDSKHYEKTHESGHDARLDSGASWQYTDATSGLLRRNAGLLVQLIGKDFRWLANSGISALFAGKNPVKGPRLKKSASTATATPEQHQRAMERAIKDYFDGIPVQGIGDLKAGSGKPWALYSIARKACYSKTTEDIRAEHAKIFREAYPDILMTALGAITDPERIAKTLERMETRHPELYAAMTGKQKALRAYFQTAQTAIRQYIRDNSAGYHRVAVNDEGIAPSKEESKAIRQARAEYYADSKYVPEVIDAYEENGQTITVYAYHEPVEHYAQRVATVDQDNQYHGATSLEEAGIMATDVSALEEALSRIDINLGEFLAEKPHDLAVARALLTGATSWRAVNSISYRRRERIRTALKDAMTL